MTYRHLRLGAAALLAVALGACSGGTPSAEEAQATACDALANAESAVSQLAEGAAAGVETVREAGVELRDAIAEMDDEVRQVVGQEVIDDLDRASNEYRRAMSGVEDQAGLDNVADELQTAGAELQTRYDAAVTELGCG